MPGAARLGDKSKCPMDAHGCKVCTHCVQGPATQGSPDVIVNGKPAVRMGDMGIHALCCGSNTWVASNGAPTVTINGKPAVRMTDTTAHCGGVGQMIQGSANVIIGNGQGRLFAAAAKSSAPFVQNIRKDIERSQNLIQQDMAYLAEKGISWTSSGSKLPDRVIAEVPPPQVEALMAAAADATPFCAVCQAA